MASLCRVILPATLHGCELASLSASSLRSLRGKCNKAVWGEHSQRNHYLAPLIGGSSIYEPWLLVFKQRRQTFRRIWASMPSVWTKWNQLVKLSIVKGVGPMSYFLLDLQFLGWEPRENGWIHLPCGSMLHIYFSNWDVVWGKLLAAWEGYVTAHVQPYKDLQGLQGLNRDIIRKLPIMRVGLLSLPSDVNISLVSRTRNAPFASHTSRQNICCCTARPLQYVEKILRNSSSNALLLRSSGGCLLVQSKSRNCMLHCVCCSGSTSPVGF